MRTKKAPQQPVSILEIAERYGVSRATVYRWLNRGDLKGARVGNGPFRVTPQSLEVFERVHGLTA